MSSKYYSQSYQAWLNMVKRCTDTNAHDYARYGGKGVTVSSGWLHSYKEFLADMGEPPEGKILDREKNELGYSKQNCRWVDPTISNLNRGVRIDSRTGITGVFLQRGSYFALARAYGKKFTLYYGKDFFEACCARKSWEANVSPLTSIGA